MKENLRATRAVVIVLLCKYIIEHLSAADSVIKVLYSQYSLASFLSSLSSRHAHIHVWPCELPRSHVGVLAVYVCPWSFDVRRPHDGKTNVATLCHL